MKDNRGFTLIEILGVIVIIAAISLLAFPPILEQIRKSHSSISEATLDLVYTGADLYIDSEKVHFWKNDGNTYCITLRSIVNKGFLNDPITDTMTNESLDLDNSVVKAVYSNHNFDYTFVTDGSCVEKSVITFEDKMRSSNEVMNNDPDQNLRYVGSDPNNYVWFNNELWRIIGLFNGQVKIIRNEHYSTSIEWDTNNLNDWSTASLQTLFNGTYLSSMQTNDTISYSYIDLIHVWNLGGTTGYESAGTTSTWTRANMYNLERGATVYSGRSTTWTGAIGLMYPSDYGYATSSTSADCDLTMYDWDYYSDCYNNSWLYDSSYEQWTLTPSSGTPDFVFFIVSGGFLYLYGDDVSNIIAARPVLYLKSNVGISGGSGTSDDPFILDRIGI